MFSPGYVLQNLYNYLLMPPKLRYNFPYIWMRMGIRTPLLPILRLPHLYFAEPITGILLSTPSVLYAAGLLLARGKGSRTGTDGAPNASLWSSLEVILAGSFVGSFGVLLAYFWASERFIMDFAPSLMMLSALGMARLGDPERGRLPRRLVLFGFMAVVTLSSVIASNFLALGLNVSDFRALDPILWQHLNNLFR